MKSVLFLVAGDPNQFTGGYIYDARIVAALRDQGHDMDVVGLAGRFPLADTTARQAMADALAACADNTIVVIDGLALGLLGDVVAAEAHRLHPVALIHHPLADEAGLALSTAERLANGERHALDQVEHVIVTSEFTARRLQTHYAVPPDRLSVVEPGVESAARPAPGRARIARPRRLLCIASIIPRKGHDILVAALARLAALDWECECIGSLNKDPACVAALRDAIAEAGLTDRIHLAGERTPAALDAAYEAADVFVLPSHYEGYGMVIVEALTHGLPIITTTGGALADTLPPAAGLAVPPGDAKALAEALESLLTDPARTAALADGAAIGGAALPSWHDAASRFAQTLAALP